MPKIIMKLKDGKIVECHAEGMKAKPISKYEKMRRVLTRNRPNPFKGFNDQIDWNKHSR